MKNRFALFFICFCISNATYALQAKFNLQQFYAPSIKNYIEIQLRILGNTATFLPTGTNANQQQASIEIKIRIEKNGNIAKFDKFRLKSPVCDSLHLESFQDIQRYALDTGKYTVFIDMQDAHDLKNKLNFEYTFAIENNEKTHFSDITLCGKPINAIAPTIYTKNGHEIYPRLQNLYQKTNDTLYFYTEIYYLNKSTITYYIQDTDDNTTLTKTKIVIKNSDFAGVKPIMNEISMADIPTGNYALVIEIMSIDTPAQKIIAKKTINFQRINEGIVRNQDFLSNDYALGFAAMYPLPAIVQHLRSLSPIALPREQLYIDNLLRNKKNDDQAMVAMQKLFRWFWEQRSPLQPAQAWATYELEVQKVQSSFGSKFVKGYDTERGRVYLKYGAPNTRNTVENDPQAYPYEIWQYNKVGTQNNVRFVFYNPNIGSTDYVLLHSEAVGETKFDNWRNQIYSRNGTGMRNIGIENGSKNLKNGKIEDMYRNN
jgi:GWxTD domain-containing protein